MLMILNISTVTANNCKLLQTTAISKYVNKDY